MSDLSDAASAVVATPPASLVYDPNVLAFQQAWNAAGNSPTLSDDGQYGPQTAMALHTVDSAAPNAVSKVYSAGPAPVSGVPGGAQVAQLGSKTDAQSVGDEVVRQWPSVVGGGTPSDTTVRILVAQSAEETGDFAGLWNWNFGNVKHVKGDGYDFFLSPDDEYKNGKKIASTFRSNPTMEAGIKDWLRVLSNSRYRQALNQAIAGDAEAFVKGLSSKGYFTGPVDSYIAGVNKYVKKYGSLSFDSTDPSPDNDEPPALLQSAVVAPPANLKAAGQFIAQEAPSVGTVGGGLLGGTLGVMLGGPVGGLLGALLGAIIGKKSS